MNIEDLIKHIEKRIKNIERLQKDEREISYLNEIKEVLEDYANDNITNYYDCNICPYEKSCFMYDECSLDLHGASIDIITIIDHIFRKYNFSRYYRHELEYYNMFLKDEIKKNRKEI